VKWEGKVSNRRAKIEGAGKLQGRVPGGRDVRKSAPGNPGLKTNGKVGLKNRNVQGKEGRF